MDQKAFFGLGYGINKNPVDMLAIYHLSCLEIDLTFFIVDEFLKLNRIESGLAENGKERLLELFGRLDRLYSQKSKILFASKIMHSDKYYSLFAGIERKINECPDLSDKVKSTVPPSKRDAPNSIDYPKHEFACVEYLAQAGYKLKIGPSKEKEYDQIMILLGININFAYLLDAYALGTKTSDSVVHYIYNSTGPNGGQRIFFEDDSRTAKAKILQGCDNALKYFCQIASVSGFLLGRQYLSREEIGLLHGRKLKHEVIKLFFDNIYNPFREISGEINNQF